MFGVGVPELVVFCRSHRCRAVAAHSTTAGLTVRICRDEVAHADDRAAGSGLVSDGSVSETRRGPHEAEQLGVPMLDEAAFQRRLDDGPEAV